MAMPSTIVGGGPAGSSRRQRGDRADGGDAEQVGEHGPQVSVAGPCTAGVRGALGVPGFHSCSPACDDLRRRAGHLAIARLAEADSQVRRPALRIVLPDCSIRDQGRWVCAFRRDGSPAALADAGGSAPVVGGPVARRTSWISPVHRSEVHLEMKEDRTVAATRMSVASANSLPDPRAHARMAEIVTAGTFLSRTRLSRYRCCAVGPGAIAATRARSGPQVPVRHEVLGLALSKTTTVTAGDSSIRVTRRASCSMEPASIRFTSPFSKVTFPVRRRDLIDDASRRGFGGMLSWLHR